MPCLQASSIPKGLSTGAQTSKIPTQTKNTKPPSLLPLHTHTHKPADRASGSNGVPTIHLPLEGNGGRAKSDPGRQPKKNTDPASRVSRGANLFRDQHDAPLNGLKTSGWEDIKAHDCDRGLNCTILHHVHHSSGRTGYAKRMADKTKAAASSQQNSSAGGEKGGDKTKPERKERWRRCKMGLACRDMECHGHVSHHEDVDHEIHDLSLVHHDSNLSHHDENMKDLISKRITQARTIDCFPPDPEAKHQEPVEDQAYDSSDTYFSDGQTEDKSYDSERSEILPTAEEDCSHQECPSPPPPPSLPPGLTPGDKAIALIGEGREDEDEKPFLEGEVWGEKKYNEELRAYFQPGDKKYADDRSEEQKQQYPLISTNPKRGLETISVILFTTQAEEVQTTDKMGIRFQKFLASKSCLASQQIEIPANLPHPLRYNEVTVKMAKTHESLKWFWQKDWKTLNHQDHFHAFKGCHTHATTGLVYHNIVTDLLNNGHVNAISSSMLFGSTATLKDTARLYVYSYLSKHPLLVTLRQDVEIYDNTITHMINQMLVMGLRARQQQTQIGSNGGGAIPAPSEGSVFVNGIVMHRHLLEPSVTVAPKKGAHKSGRRAKKDKVGDSRSNQPPPGGKNKSVSWSNRLSSVFTKRKPPGSAEIAPIPPDSNLKADVNFKQIFRRGARTKAVSLRETPSASEPSVAK